MKEKTNSPTNPPPDSAQFMDHLAELRQRLLRSLYAVLGFTLVGLIFCKEIFHWLQIPMLKALAENGHFITTAPFESYAIYFKLAVVAGFFGATPFIFYQFWQFVAPGLVDKERQTILPFAIISAALFVGGAVFGYFVVFPAGFTYANMMLEGTGITLFPKMSDYFDVAVTLLVAFGVTFELPLVIFFLGKMGIIDSATIREQRRIVIVGLFILAAVLTPGPDVLSQCLLAFPLCILYELGGLSLKLLERRETKP